MTKKILSALACLGFAAQAGAQVNFDKGVDVKETIAQAQAAGDDKAAPPYYGGHRVRYSRDCETFRYGPYDSGTSARAYLESYEYIEECRFVPKPPPPPPPPPKPPKPPRPPAGGNNGGGHQPRPKAFGEYTPWTQSGYQPGHEYSYSGSQNGREGTWYCRERVGQVFRNTAQMELGNRQLLPWESESFEVCMEGPRADFDVRQSPYSYSVDRVGMYDLYYRLTPRYRVPTPPDPDGLYHTSFTHSDGKFRLAVQDRWPQYYPGEKVAIKVELMKDGFLFFNSSKGEKEFVLDSASSYELVFGEGDLVKTKEALEGETLEKADRGPAKYFVKWGFRRIGSVSSDSYIGKGSTDKIQPK